MPPPPAPSNIRAFVRWREPNVYAGEEIECIITFKNVGTVPDKDKEQEGQQKQFLNGFFRDQRRLSYAPSAAHSRRSSIAQSIAPSTRAPSVTSAKALPQVKGHRPTLSLNVVSGPSRAVGPQSAPLAAKAPHSAVQGHGRSLSIMSLGSDRANDGYVPSQGPPAKRSAKPHARSTSLQTVSRPQMSPYTGPLPRRQPSPLFESSTPPPLAEGVNEQLPVRPTRRKAGTMSANNTPQLARQNSLQKHSSPNSFEPSFQFPGSRPKVKSPSPQPETSYPRRTSSKMASEQQRAISPRPPDGWSAALGNLHPISRVMSETSTAGTPRSSSEFYSMSNHSDETVTSDLPYQTHQNGRLSTSATPSQQYSKSRHASSNRTAQPETLMMGYAQTMGYFVLDGSLINAAPFEEVKRKGVQSGGGVIGVERSKQTSGMFGALSWGSIGQSLGGLLGGDEISSMAQMKATAGSKSIPLLSTPQNLLFVDLKLEPGESKCFSYRFSLPRGLPPTHKGRVMKVSYHLALGVQRPEGQTVSHIEVPFRILGSYNARGETLGHDLMSPYILVEDAARSSNITSDTLTDSGVPAFPPKEASKQAPKQGLEDFLRYTERLLEQSRDTRDALVSPTSPIAPPISQTQSQIDQAPASVGEAVNLAILRSNHVGTAGKQRQVEAQSANRFNITRAGHSVAVLTLLRPAYRLGEAVIGTIDFTASAPESGATPQAPTFSVLAELESAERVDASLALRSSSSINRVTRKVHSAVRENTLFSRQISLSLSIPSTATPTFETTGVSLAWKLRVEFTTQRHVQGLGLDEQTTQGDGELLEELGRDDRGTTLIAKERLTADTFEIAVPLRVLGTPGIDGLGVESEPPQV